MKYICIFSISFLFLLSSCESNDNPELDTTDVNEALIGKWALLSLFGGWAPTEIFTDDEVIWNFYSADLLQISINTELSDKTRLPFTTDTIVHYACDSIYISIGNNEYKYSVEDETLKIDGGVSYDGIMMIFEKK